MIIEERRLQTMKTLGNSFQLDRYNEKDKKIIEDYLELTSYGVHRRKSRKRRAKGKRLSMF